MSGCRLFVRSDFTGGCRSQLGLDNGISKDHPGYLIGTEVGAGRIIVACLGLDTM